MRVAIRMLDAPRRGLGAFLPGLTPGPAPSSQGLLSSRIQGHPGTLAVPSPRPAALSDGELGGPYNQPSSVAPNYFQPCVYVPRPAPMVMHRESTNDLPVKAPYIARSGQQTQYRTRIGGSTATAWPRPFIMWPTYGGGAA